VQLALHALLEDEVVGATVFSTAGGFHVPNRSPRAAARRRIRLISVCSSVSGEPLIESMGNVAVLMSINVALLPRISFQFAHVFLRRVG
jgi:hypothetical protein